MMGRLSFWMKQVTGASCRNERLIRLLRGKVFAHRPQLFSAMGAARDDKEGRQDGVMRGFRPSCANSPASPTTR